MPPAREDVRQPDVKTIRNYFLGACAFVCAVLAGPLIAQSQTTPPPAGPPPPASVPPVVEYVRVDSPEALQSKILTWIGVATAVVTGLAGLAAHVMAKVQEVRERMDRMDARHQGLQAQVVDVAKNVPPAGSPPIPLLFAALALCLSTTACVQPQAQQLPKLPPGSYFEGRAGYAKDEGASVKGVIHIPLSKRHSTPPTIAKRTSRWWFASLN